MRHVFLCSSYERWQLRRRRLWQLLRRRRTADETECFDEDGGSDAAESLNPCDDESCDSDDSGFHEPPLKNERKKETPMLSTSDIPRNSRHKIATLVREFGKDVEKEEVSFLPFYHRIAASLKMFLVDRFKSDVELYRDVSCTDLIDDRDPINEPSFFFELISFYEYEGGATREKLKQCYYNSSAVSYKLFRVEGANQCHRLRKEAQLRVRQFF